LAQVGVYSPGVISPALLSKSLLEDTTKVTIRPGNKKCFPGFFMGPGIFTEAKVYNELGLEVVTNKRKMIVLMQGLRDLDLHHKKTVSVIMSCTTLEQMDVARRYMENLYKLHVGYKNDMPTYQHKYYNEKLVESIKLCTTAFENKRKKLVREFKRG